jgi:hypothetical protein
MRVPHCTERLQLIELLLRAVHDLERCLGVDSVADPVDDLVSRDKIHGLPLLFDTLVVKQTTRHLDEATVHALSRTALVKCVGHTLLVLDIVLTD